MRRGGPALTLLLAMAPGLAHAAQAPCLTAGEFAAVTTFALPGAIRGAAQRCSDVLPPTAFLRTDGERLAVRYASTRDGSWPRARSGLAKAGGVLDPQAPQLVRSLPDSELKPLVDELVIALVDQRLPPQRCKSLDRLVMLLAPLPAASAAGTIAVATGIAARTGRRSVGQLTICRA